MVLGRTQDYGHFCGGDHAVFRTLGSFAPLEEDSVPDISISDFSDFVLRTGTAKITKVAEIFGRGEYNPAHDFWKPLRDNICEFHEGKVSSISFGASGAHEKKQVRYEEAIKGYKKFLVANKPAWFKPHRAEWEFEDLAVRVNPEVGFEIDGVKYLVKLYFKRETLSKSRVQVILGLMRSVQKSKSFKIGILDVVRAKLHIEGKVTPQIEALLKGEALSFLTIWESLVEG